MLENIFGGLITGALTGLVTGIVSSGIVSCLFHRDSRLDIVLTLVKACCPYRAESVRGADGLGDTAHALIIESEIMDHVGFCKTARIVASVAAEMNELASQSMTEAEGDKQARDTVKRQWEEQITALYRPYFPLWFRQFRR